MINDRFWLIKVLLHFSLKSSDVILRFSNNNVTPDFLAELSALAVSESVEGNIVSRLLRSNKV